MRGQQRELGSGAHGAARLRAEDPDPLADPIFAHSRTDRIDNAAAIIVRRDPAKQLKLSAGLTAFRIGGIDHGIGDASPSPGTGSGNSPKVITFVGPGLSYHHARMFHSPPVESAI